MNSFRRSALLFFATALTLACGSGGASRPASITAPLIDLVPPSSIFFGSSSSAPANIDVSITNTANVPLTVRSIELSSPGMVQYGIVPIRRTFNDTIEAGQTRSFPIFATAVAQGRTRALSEPLVLRGIVTFASGKQQFREIVLQR